MSLIPPPLVLQTRTTGQTLSDARPSHPQMAAALALHFAPEADRPRVDP